METKSARLKKGLQISGYYSYDKKKNRQVKDYTAY